MHKQMIRIAGPVAMMLLIVSVITAAFADGKQTGRTGSLEFTAASPTPTPPAKKSENSTSTPASRSSIVNGYAAEFYGGRLIVGTCNRARGCKELEAACKTMKGHSFKATAPDGSLGVCTEPTAKSANTAKVDPQQATKRLVAPTSTSAATLYCHGTAICRKVKNICAALGGNYTDHDQSGSCNY